MEKDAFNLSEDIKKVWWDKNKDWILDKGNE